MQSPINRIFNIIAARCGDDVPQYRINSVVESSETNRRFRVAKEQHDKRRALQFHFAKCIRRGEMYGTVAVWRALSHVKKLHGITRTNDARVLAILYSERRATSLADAVSRTTIQPASQPTIQPASQPFSQPANQPVSQPATELRGLC